MKKYFLKSIYTIILFSCRSCAWVIHGTRQPIVIRSSPPGVTIILNDSVYGKTPMTMKMKRKKKEHHIKLSLDGYETYQTDLYRTVDGWVAGNILIGGLIGLGIDALSGSMYRLSPDIVKVDLKKNP